MNLGLLSHSITVAGSTAILALAIGALIAFTGLGLAPRWRAWLFFAAVLTLALPPFLVVNAWIGLFGAGGSLSAWWSFPILPTPATSPGTLSVSLGPTVMILTLMYWPVAFFLFYGAWQRLPAELLEGEPRLTGASLLRWLLIPAARSAAGLTLAVTFVLALNQFAVPALLQVKVYPAEVWVRFSTNLDTRGALLLSWPMILAPALLLAMVWRREIPWPRLSGALPRALFRRHAGRWIWTIASSTSLIAIFLSVLVPLVELVASARTWVELFPALRAGGAALSQSFLSAAVTATAVVSAAIVSARRPVFGLTWLLFLMPGVVLGVMLITLLNRPPLVALYQSAGVVVLAWFLRFFAPAWAIIRRALASVDPDLRDVARLEGAGIWDRFRLVIWPQVGGLIAAAWYLVFLLCLWDTETLVLIMPPGGETLALRIFNFLHYGHNAQVNALCLVLLTAATLPLILWGVSRRCAKLLRSHSWRWTLWLPAILLIIGAGCSPNPQDYGALRSRIFGAVQVFGTRGAGTGQFVKPRSVAVDATDNFYVVDMTGRVQRFSPEGEYQESWQMPETDIGKPKGMCRDQQGGIVVLEPHYARVNHFSPQGRLLDQWGLRGTNAGCLSFPRAVAVAPDGRSYVSEYATAERVQEFGPDRQLLRVIGSAGRAEGQFNRAEGLGLDRAGRLYVADSCNHRIQVFDRDGRFIRAYGRAGTAPGEFSYPYDIRVDDQGRQYVCEFGNSRIQIFDDQGRWLETLGGPGAGPGRFSNPWALALDSHGNLYVADSMNHRVQKFIRRDSPG